MNPEKPLRPTQFAENKLLTAILKEEYPPGSSFPSERNLAQIIGVTRPTLRETLQRMAGEGWITIQHGKPTVVNDYIKDGGMGMLTTLSKHVEYLPPGFIKHFLEVRCIFFPAISQMACERNAGIFEKYLNDASHLGDDPVEFADYDWTLQMMFAIHSGNPIYRMILHDFTLLYKTMGSQYFGHETARDASHNYYRELLKAMKQKDSERVGEVVRFTMEEALEIWSNLIEG